MATPDNKTSQARDTGLAVTLILLIVAICLHSLKLIPPAIAVLLITMTWPPAFKPLAPVWFGFSKILGAVVSRIIFSLIFILVASPVGLLRKALGKDAMKLKLWKSGGNSVFTEKTLTYTSEHLEKPF